MTVSQLIEELQELDGDLPVMISHVRKGSQYFDCEVTGAWEDYSEDFMDCADVYHGRERVDVVRIVA
jgi:hypothetical protein